MGASALVGLAAFSAPRAMLHLDDLSWLMPNGLGSVLIAAPAAFLALNGFGTVAAAGEQVVRAEHTVGGDCGSDPRRRMYTAWPSAVTGGGRALQGQTQRICLGKPNSAPPPLVEAVRV